MGMLNIIVHMCVVKSSISENTYHVLQIVTPVQSHEPQWKAI